jgi:transcriptional regulator with XRE-family HTH domain
MSRRHETDLEYERLVAQEELILDATEAIVTLLDVQGVSRQELAERLGKSKGFVSQLLSGERNMTLRTLSDLAFVLGRRFRLSAEPRSDACRNATAQEPQKVFIAPRDALRPKDADMERRGERAAAQLGQKVSFADLQRAVPRRDAAEATHEYALVG